MHGPGSERGAFGRALHAPIARIVVGIVVCVSAALGANALLRLVPTPDLEAVRAVRWVLTALILLATYRFLFGRYERRTITELSVGALPLEGLIGLVAGAASLALVVIVLHVIGCYELISTGGLSILPVLLAYFFVLAVLEEVVFRGILYRIVEERLGTNLALLISAVLFGLAHLPNEHANAASVLSAASGGILVGLLFSLTRRLWLPIFFHTGWNLAQASLGVAVSGLEDMPVFAESRLEGPDLLTGGAFGLENSVVTIALVLVLSGLAYHLTRKRGLLVPKGAGGALLSAGDRPSHGPASPG